MKAILLREPAPIESAQLEMVEAPMPKPGPGDVLLRVKACGVCHTDLHIVEGEIPQMKLPVIPGHQVIGEVEALGPGVERFQVGERVGVPWLHSTCGTCDSCRRGEENLCEKAQFTGYHVDGGYAEYLRAPAAFCYRIPVGYSDVLSAPLLCAGVIGYRALSLSGYQPGEKIGLFGFGASAHIVLQIAVYQGCEVYVFTRSENHKSLARDLGAVWVGGVEEKVPALLDRAILFAPSGRLVPKALRMLRKGGVLSIAVIYMDRIPELSYRDHLYWEKTIKSVTNSTRKDVEDLLALAPLIPIRTEAEAFPLGEARRVLQMMKESKLRGAAVLQPHLP